MRDYRSQLVGLANAYAAHRGVSLARISTLVRNDGKFFASLNDGAACTVDTYCDVVQWFAEHWPPRGLRWPSGIKRPTVAKPAAPAKVPA